MDFRPSETQQLLAGIARDFLARHCPPTLVQELALDPRGFRDDLWKEMSALGWPGLLIPSALGGANLVLMDTERRGIMLTPLETMSGEKLFELNFAGVDVREGDLLGPAGGGWDALVPALHAGALARSAEMLGCAQRILDLCVEYARVRVQSGRPIGSFQAIQHAC